MASQAFQTIEQRLAAGDMSAMIPLIELAQRGDPDAEFRTAEFCLRGIGGVYDVDDALALMVSAAGKGHCKAGLAHAYFVAAGIGCTADPQKARQMIEPLAGKDAAVGEQLALFDRLSCHSKVATAARETVSSDPQIELVRGLFGEDECRYLRKLAEPALEPAMVYSSDGHGIRDPHRDSDNMVIAPMIEDLVVNAVNRCIAAASATEYRWGEPLHILRYRPGQQYRPHYDADSSTPLERRRLATALLYLNDDYDGGESRFPDLDLSVKGRTGDLLIFRNLLANGEPDMRMIHAGLPVTEGEKWLATRWIRTSDIFARG